MVIAAVQFISMQKYNRSKEKKIKRIGMKFITEDDMFNFFENNYAFEMNYQQSKEEKMENMVWVEKRSHVQL